MCFFVEIVWWIVEFVEVLLEGVVFVVEVGLYVDVLYWVVVVFGGMFVVVEVGCELGLLWVLVLVDLLLWVVGGDVEVLVLFEKLFGVYFFGGNLFVLDSDVVVVCWFVEVLVWELDVLE